VDPNTRNYIQVGRTRFSRIVTRASWFVKDRQMISDYSFKSDVRDLLRYDKLHVFINSKASTYYGSNFHGNRIVSECRLDGKVVAKGMGISRKESLTALAINMRQTLESVGNQGVFDVREKVRSKGHLHNRLLKIASSTPGVDVVHSSVPGANIGIVRPKAEPAPVQLAIDSLIDSFCSNEEELQYVKGAVKRTAPEVTTVKKIAKNLTMKGKENTPYMGKYLQVASMLVEGIRNWNVKKVAIPKFSDTAYVDMTKHVKASSVGNENSTGLPYVTKKENAPITLASDVMDIMTTLKKLSRKPNLSFKDLDDECEFGILVNRSVNSVFKCFLKPEVKDCGSEAEKLLKDIICRVIDAANSSMTAQVKWFFADYMDFYRHTFADGTSIGMSNRNDFAQRLHDFFFKHPETLLYLKRYFPESLGEVLKFLSLDATKMDKSFECYLKMLGFYRLLTRMAWDTTKWTYNQEICLYFIANASLDICYPLRTISDNTSDLLRVTHQLPSGHPLTTYFGNWFTHSHETVLALVMATQYYVDVEKNESPIKGLIERVRFILRKISHGDDTLMAFYPHICRRFSPKWIADCIKYYTGVLYKFGESHVEGGDYIPFLSKIDLNTGKVLTSGVDYLKKRFVEINDHKYFFHPRKTFES
jgi:hypothetical protein